MSKNDYKRVEAVKRLLGPIGRQLSCGQCFEQVDEYVELELAGIEAETCIPGLGAHLDGCSACKEDHESLRALLTADAASPADQR